MNRFFYSLSLRCLSPFLLAWMGLRARRAGGDWGVVSAERFGRLRKAPVLPNLVWVHAVSLGETRAAQPLVRALLERGENVLLTHLTVTGREEGARAFAREIEQGRLIQQWLPYDFPGATARFLDHYKPVTGILIEREVWPNLLAAARRRNVPMMLVSARFSDNALRTVLRAGKVLQEAYAGLSVVHAQTLQDAQRLEQAGVAAVRVSGNFKFDVRVSAEQVEKGREFVAVLNRRVITIASTREGEDEMFIQAIQKHVRRMRSQGQDLEETAVFRLVPRHPQRFEAAAQMLAEAELPFVRRSATLQYGDCSASAVREAQNAMVLLGDTVGEMARYYASSHVAIVGGSFAPLGGQNLIEACAVGVPVIVGPNTHNFEQAVSDAIHAGAALRAPDAEAALQLALQLLDDPRRLAQMSEAGVDWVLQHTGAVQRVMDSYQALRGE
ncbi:3-deoxy-D-manno-octulosonic acid transferase [Achromobacter sp. F4_2707]|uniref:3-deoxy-D-manno-octulosonic acid transferase n=1 Tax=Achromobacter sp. F4_2707 TaxID=3114286 RepID=UPI0039C6EE28